MNMPFEDLLKALLGEAYVRRNAIVVMFVLISLSFLAVGTVWPKKYTAFVIISANDTNILQPLMEGTAEATRVKDLASNAREIIFGEKIMEEVLVDADWLKNEPTSFEQERIKKSIKEKVKIKKAGKNLLRIEFKDSDPIRAYITVKRMAELFIKEGEKSKTEESKAAYDFIEMQVNEYLQKLTEVEDKLREYRSKNPDSRPGLESEVSNRISGLQTEIERAKMQLRETVIRRNSLQEQLSGEAAVTISQSREGQYRSKIVNLQTRLETLRLDYKETYPDIVRIKHQIEDLKQAMNEEISRREEARNRAVNKNRVYIDEAIMLSPLYQQLRSDASNAETEIATLKARISEMNKMLESQYDRGRKIHDGEAALTKLTRNYQVNQDIYQDLLKRRERARVSKSLDEENKGLTFKIQEPAKVPLLPTGMRFIHFAAAGVVLGFAVPIGLIFLLIQVDPRIRFAKIISNDLNLPVLAEINRMFSYKEKRREKINIAILVIIIGAVMFIYGYVGWLRFTGQMQ